MKRVIWAGLLGAAIAGSAATFGWHYGLQPQPIDGVCSKLPKLNTPNRYRQDISLRGECPWAFNVDDKAEHYGLMVLGPHGVTFWRSPTPGHLPAQWSWFMDAEAVELAMDEIADGSLAPHVRSLNGPWLAVKFSGWHATRRTGGWPSFAGGGEIILVDRFVEVESVAASRAASEK